MPRVILATAAIAAGLCLATPASALPFLHGVAPAASIEQARVVKKKVVVGPRCRTVVKTKVNRFGRVVKVRKKTCL